MTDKTQNKQSKTHWKKLVNPLYIGAYTLNPNEDLIVKIKSVGRELVTSNGGKKEECTVAFLENQKPMILNATNSKTIAKLYGSYIEDWTGKLIQLYASKTMLAGENVECLRIRNIVPCLDVKPRPQITPERFEAALKSIVSGEYTFEKLEQNFDLSPEQLDSVDIARDAIR